jgi:lipid-A-disaccharide synthase
MTAADVAMVTSGTATLETMLYKTPMIIAYRMSALIFPLVKWLVKTPYVGLPNIIANELLVPELIQDKVQPDVIAALLLDLLDHPEKIKVLKEKFTVLHESLRVGSANASAEAVLKLLNI